MEDRGPVLRLVLIGVIGLGLLLVARWMAGRMAASASSTEATSAETRTR